eukprot:404354-Hanusia_phi.AAC.1
MGNARLLLPISLALKAGLARKHVELDVLAKLGPVDRCRELEVHARESSGSATAGRALGKGPHAVCRSECTDERA